MNLKSKRVERRGAAPSVADYVPRGLNAQALAKHTIHHKQLFENNFHFRPE